MYKEELIRRISNKAGRALDVKDAYTVAGISREILNDLIDDSEAEMRFKDLDANTKAMIGDRLEILSSKIVGQAEKHGVLNKDEYEAILNADNLSFLEVGTSLKKAEVKSSLMAAGERMILIDGHGMQKLPLTVHTAAVNILNAGYASGLRYNADEETRKANIRANVASMAQLNLERASIENNAQADANKVEEALIDAAALIWTGNNIGNTAAVVSAHVAGGGDTFNFLNYTTIGAGAVNYTQHLVFCEQSGLGIGMDEGSGILDALLENGAGNPWSTTLGFYNGPSVTFTSSGVGVAIPKHTLYSPLAGARVPGSPITIAVGAGRVLHNVASTRAEYAKYKNYTTYSSVAGTADYVGVYIRKDETLGKRIHVTLRDRATGSRSISLANFITLLRSKSLTAKKNNTNFVWTICRAWENE